MNKQKVLWIVLMACVLSNLFLLYHLFFGRPHPQHKPEPKMMIIEKLNFNETQQIQYEALIEEHRESIRNTESEMLQLKKILYAEITSDKTESANAIIHQIGDLQENIERIHYRHFMDIRQLCTPDQMPLFESLAQDLPALFAPPKPPNRKLHP